MNEQPISKLTYSNVLNGFAAAAFFLILPGFGMYTARETFEFASIWAWLLLVGGGVCLLFGAAIPAMIRQSLEGYKRAAGTVLAVGFGALTLPDNFFIASDYTVTSATEIARRFVSDSVGSFLILGAGTVWTVLEFLNAYKERDQCRKLRLPSVGKAAFNAKTQSTPRVEDTGVADGSRDATPVGCNPPDRTHK